MKQYIYNVDTIKKNFLASYADTIIKENKLFLVNILTDRQILVEGNHSLLEQFVLKLEMVFPMKNYCISFRSWAYRICWRYY